METVPSGASQVSSATLAPSTDSPAAPPDMRLLDPPPSLAEVDRHPDNASARPAARNVDATVARLRVKEPFIISLLRLAPTWDK